MDTTPVYLTPTPLGVVPTISKNAQRRLDHTHLIYEGEMVHKDGKARWVRWLRLDMKYLDRSKYNGNGTRK